MDEILVKSKSHPYTIFIGENIRYKLNHFLSKKYASILIITDDNVANLYLDDITSSLNGQVVFKEVIFAGEGSKNIQTFYSLHTKAIEYKLDRESLIIALGGGVVGDLAGFVASTYMRGIDYIQVPTTILSHDSSVGGKVAINHELGKNLIGNFYPPKMVVYDVQTLQSLSRQDIRSGYAELIKEALIADLDFFNELINTDLNRIDNQLLINHLKKGIGIKAAIVEQDESEVGNRRFLNLGHTLGHALENELGYGSISHGEAVAVGLLFALYVSKEKLGSQLPETPLLNWLCENEFPLYFEQINPEAIFHKMKTDKKTVQNKVRMVLLKEVARPVIVELDDQELEFYLTSFFK